MVLNDAQASDPRREQPHALHGLTLQYERADPHTLAKSRNRGNAAWGATSLALALSSWLFPIVLVLSEGSLRSSQGAEALPAWIELALLAGALIFGTIGYRKPAGRKMAFAGRLIAWGTPPLAQACLLAMRGFGLFSLLAIILGFLFWGALGFVIAVIVDVMVET